VSRVHIDAGSHTAKYAEFTVDLNRNLGPLHEIARQSISVLHRTDEACLQYAERVQRQNSDLIASLNSGRSILNAPDTRALTEALAKRDARADALIDLLHELHAAGAPGITKSD
jgi:hypothetical protein